MCSNIPKPYPVSKLKVQWNTQNNNTHKKNGETGETQQLSMTTEAKFCCGKLWEKKSFDTVKYVLW